MKGRRHTLEQVVRSCGSRQAARGGRLIPEVAKALEVSENTFHRWRAQYGGMKADDVKRLKELERENQTLKRIVANKEVEIEGLEGDREGKLVSPSRRRQAVLMLVDRLVCRSRRACLIAGQHRSTQRRELCVAPDAAACRTVARDLGEAAQVGLPSRASVYCLKEGWSLNASARSGCGARRPQGSAAAPQAPAPGHFDGASKPVACCAP